MDLKMYDSKSLGNRIFNMLNNLFLILLALACLFPFINIVASSFVAVEEFMARNFILIPRTFSLDAYRFVLSTPTIFRSIWVSIGVTVVGTFLSIILTSFMAYALSRRYLTGRKLINFLVLFTLLFSGGMIPTFLVVRDLGLINSYWSLILPSAISAFNLIIMKNFFQGLPDSLEESAKIDGCNDFMIFLKIIVPLSMASFATIALFYAVSYWNAITNGLLYLTEPDKWPLQLVLRQLVLVSSGIQGDASSVEGIVPPAQTLQMAVIVISIMPMLVVYPFVQKHFVKGSLMGSVKG
jgi:putative aldouronate transport system permease protein